nr:hypothetical protein [Candidatus Sigynarchaeum springense]
MAKRKATGKTEKVKQVVFSALLEALNEIIGQDGKMSVIRFAGLGTKYAQVRPSLITSLPKTDLIRLTTAMNRLLGYGSKALLRETGRKFAIYLHPYGYSLETLIEKMKKWIDGTWDITIKKEKDGFKITVNNDPLFSASYIWAGFFEVAAANSSPDGAKFVASEVVSKREQPSTTFELKKQ